jgi:hypothetical protein
LKMKSSEQLPTYPLDYSCSPLRHRKSARPDMAGVINAGRLQLSYYAVMDMNKYMGIRVTFSIAQNMKK